jgi:hypothetical protein
VQDRQAAVSRSKFLSDANSFPSLEEMFPDFVSYYIRRVCFD